MRNYKYIVSTGHLPPPFYLNTFNFLLLTPQLGHFDTNFIPASQNSLSNLFLTFNPESLCSRDSLRLL